MQKVNTLILQTLEQMKNTFCILLFTVGTCIQVFSQKKI